MISDGVAVAFRKERIKPITFATDNKNKKKVKRAIQTPEHIQAFAIQRKQALPYSEQQTVASLEAKNIIGVLTIDINRRDFLRGCFSTLEAPPPSRRSSA